MEGILHTFGIDARLIVIQIVNFTLLLIALWYFLYTPILTMLKNREEKIAQGIRDAEAAAKAKDNAESEKKEVLRAAHKEAEEVGLRAKVFAEEKSAEIVKEAEEKASQIVKSAEEKSKEHALQAQKENEAEVAKAAVLAAEKILQAKSS